MLKKLITFLLDLFNNKSNSSITDLDIEEKDLIQDLYKEEKEEIVAAEEESVKENVPEVKEEPLKIKKHFLAKDSYFPVNNKKEWLFLHHTAGWENPFRVIDSWNRSPIKIATEFLIGGVNVVNQNDEYDGVVVRAFPKGGYAWHLGVGRRKVHTHSVGVELNSFGYLTKGGYTKKVNKKRVWVDKDPEKFYTYTGREVHNDQVIELEKEFRGYKYWHNYSPAQLEALKKLIYHIRDEEGIDITKGIVELIKEKGAHQAFDFYNLSHVENNPGLWLHTNVQKGKYDLYPHPELIKLLLSL